MEDSGHIRVDTENGCTVAHIYITRLPKRVSTLVRSVNHSTILGYTDFLECLELRGCLTQSISNRIRKTASNSAALCGSNWRYTEDTVWIRVESVDSSNCSSEAVIKIKANRCGMASVGIRLDEIVASFIGTSEERNTCEWDAHNLISVTRWSIRKKNLSVHRSRSSPYWCAKLSIHSFLGWVRLNAEWCTVGCVIHLEIIVLGCWCIRFWVVALVGKSVWFNSYFHLSIRFLSAACVSSSCPWALAIRDCTTAHASSIAASTSNGFSIFSVLELCCKIMTALEGSCTESSTFLSVILNNFNWWGINACTEDLSS